MLQRLGVAFAVLLATSAAVRARQLTDERVLADLYAAPPRATETGTWRLGEREVSILLVAAYQEDGVQQQLYVTAAAEPGAAGFVGASLYARQGTDWTLVAHRAELLATAAGASRGSPRLVRLSPRRHGFMVQETKTVAGESSSFVTVAAPGRASFEELLKVATEYRGLGGGRIYRGCGPSSPATLPCSRHARLSFVPGGAELFDAELAAQIAVGEGDAYSLPATIIRYAFDGERYRPIESESQTAARALESFFADWLESRADAVPPGRFAARHPALSPDAAARFDDGPLAHLEPSRLGYIAVGVHTDGGRATADAVPIETVARGGAGRIPLRLERQDGRWRIVALGESASR